MSFKFCLVLILFVIWMFRTIEVFNKSTTLFPIVGFLSMNIYYISITFVVLVYVDILLYACTCQPGGKFMKKYKFC